ncbi:MAG: hypothetical protein LUF85_06615 [Bacteroides sp.]|nr:hypothetical protein [Bacteroides sp.]
MKKDYNLYELTKMLERICQAHPIVGNFLTNVYQLGETDDITYPVVALTLNNVTRRENTLDFSLNILYADRLTDNRDNTITAQSVGITVLLEMLNLLHNHTNVIVPGDYQIIPFQEQFADNTAGVYVPVILKVPNYVGDCTWIDPDCIECQA